MRIKTRAITVLVTVFVLPLLALANLPYKIFGKVATGTKALSEAGTNCFGVTDTGGERPGGQK